MITTVGVWELWAPLFYVKLVGLLGSSATPAPIRALGDGLLASVGGEDLEAWGRNGGRWARIVEGQRAAMLGNPGPGCQLCVARQPG